jgi:hypothetical protein
MFHAVPDAQEISGKRQYLPVLGYILRIGQRMVLRLQSDLDDFHRGDDHDRLGRACQQSRYAHKPMDLSAYPARHL